MGQQGMGGHIQAPVENDLKKGWKVLREDFRDHTKNVRGAVTKAQIAYLMRDQLILLPEDDENEDEYADFEQQLIARHPIIQADHTAVAEETLEKSGPRKKCPQVLVTALSCFTS